MTHPTAVVVQHSISVVVQEKCYVLSIYLPRDHHKRQCIKYKCTSAILLLTAYFSSKLLL